MANTFKYKKHFLSAVFILSFAIQVFGIDIATNEKQNKIQEVLFIDTKVENFSSLLKNLRSEITPVLLSNKQNELIQMVDFLKNHPNTKSIHVVSHSTDGELKIGNTLLNKETIHKYSKELATLNKLLDKDTELLLYGCELAKSSKGKNFIKELAFYTNTKIAASTNLTGSSYLNGD